MDNDLDLRNIGNYEDEPLFFKIWRVALCLPVELYNRKGLLTLRIEDEILQSISESISIILETKIVLSFKTYAVPAPTLDS